MFNRRPRLFQTIVWTVVVGSIVTGTVMFFAGWLEPHDVGYSGVFLINLIGSASVIIPVPGLAAVCAAAAPNVGLNMVGIGLLGGTGATIGEITGYLAGYGGHSFVQRSRYYDRVQRLVIRRGAFALFVLAVLPMPLFDVAGIAAGSLGYPVRRFLIWVFFGKIIKSIGTAYACQQSIDWFTDLVGL
ncbi:MAG: VTT domain-containing protein [Chloroflexi bacterium]|nr:VTT domain-containing protein [Chloroflexota bacterium]